MRDLLVASIVFGCLPFTSKRPFWGILMLAWLGYMNPRRLCYKFMHSISIVLKCLDRWFMTVGALPCFKSLRCALRLDQSDAQICCRDDYAATRLARSLNVQVTITMRGKWGTP